MEIKVSASLLASDLSDIAGEARRCERAGVDLIHFDVMDGRFVEQITYGAPVLKCLRPVTRLPLDVHLMVEDPTRQIEFFANAGADIITVHAESGGDTAGQLRRIKELGVRASLALKPATPAKAAFPYIALCDMVLVMTVEPGYGGQGFMEDMLGKTAQIREYSDAQGFPALDIEVDGGINVDTARRAVGAGANVLVAGTTLFTSGSVEEMSGLCAAMKG